MGNSISNSIAAASQMDPIPMEALLVVGAGMKEPHGKNIAILRSISATISAISSSALMWMITRSHKGLSTTQHRLLLGLCLFDISSSLGVVFSNPMAPSDLAYMVWNVRGNEASCDAQGFLIVMGVTGGIFYNAALNLYYLAVVKYGKSDDYIRAKIEPFLHGVPIVAALAYSITALIRKHFNDDGYGSCYSPVHYPLHCVGYSVDEVRDGFEIPCGRGIEGAEAMVLYSIVSMFMVAVTVLASLALIFKAVRDQEKKLSKYGVGALRAGLSANFNSTTQASVWERIKTSMHGSRRSSTPSVIRSKNAHNQSRAVMHRAFGYSFAWVLSYGSQCVGLVIQLVTSNYPLILFYVTSIFIPLQGFFNLTIYMYPKVISTRNKNTKRGGKDVSLCKAILIVFFSSKGDDGRKKKSNLHHGNMHPSSHSSKDPQSLRLRNKAEKNASREPQEEEEKYEIQPLTSAMVPRQEFLRSTYTSNLSLDQNSKGADLEVATIEEDKNEYTDKDKNSPISSSSPQGTIVTDVPDSKNVLLMENDVHMKEEVGSDSDSEAEDNVDTSREDNHADTEEYVQLGINLSVKESVSDGRHDDENLNTKEDHETNIK